MLRIVAEKDATVTAAEALNLWLKDKNGPTVMFGTTPNGKLYVRGVNDWRMVAEPSVCDAPLQDPTITPKYLLSVAELIHLLEGVK